MSDLESIPPNETGQQTSPAFYVESFSKERTRAEIEPELYGDGLVGISYATLWKAAQKLGVTSINEVVLWVHPVIVAGNERQEEPEQEECLELFGGRLQMYPDPLEVYIDGERKKTYFRSFKVLELLVRNAGKVVTREQIIDTCWDGIGASSKTLSMTILDVRNFLGKELAAAIVTERGVGYMLIKDFDPSAFNYSGTAAAEQL